MGPAIFSLAALLVLTPLIAEGKGAAGVQVVAIPLVVTPLAATPLAALVRTPPDYDERQIVC